MTRLSVTVPSLRHETTRAYSPRNGTEMLVKIGSPVGQGVFGCVFSATVDQEKDSVLKRALSGEDQEENLIALGREKIFYDLVGAHENIMGYRGTTPRGGLLMPRAAQDLKSVIAEILRNPDLQVRKQKTFKIIHQMLKAALHLKQKNCFHNDPHIGNWLVGEDGKVKLIDFGLASEKQAEGLSDYAIFISRAERERLFFSYHPVKTIRNLLQATGTDHVPESRKILEKLDDIFIFDLAQAVSQNYQEAREQDRTLPETPSRSFIRTMINLFLSNRTINDADHKDRDYEEPRKNELRRRINGVQEKPLADGETVNILKKLIKNEEIFSS